MQKCLHGVTLKQVAAIVAKSESEFYFRQRLLRLVSDCIARLDGEMFPHAATLAQRHFARQVAEKMTPCIRTFTCNPTTLPTK
jgi:hypothetical protein